MTANKNDIHARDHWGSELYDALPKSVWATVAWRLADRLAGGDEKAEDLFADELRALVHNGIIPEAQILALRRIAKRGK